MRFSAEFGLLKIPPFIKKLLHDEKVTVWCELIASIDTEPFFFEKMRDFHFETASVIARRYSDIL